MSQALTTTEPMAASVLENVLVHGDLSKLDASQRLEYYAKVCASVDLNPLTKPFLYITLNGKLTLYAARDATDQIRAKKHISVLITARERHDDLYVVTARASTPEGRTDESIGAVAITGLKGEALANALMKAETKAKRRVTLSIGGLGWLDETEVDSIPDARRADVDMATGEIIPSVPALPPAAVKGTFEDGVVIDADVIPFDAGPSATTPPWEDSKSPQGPGPSGSGLLVCEVCGEELTDTKFRDGTVWTPAQLAAYGRRKHNKVLCMGDYKAANDAKKAG